MKKIFRILGLAMVVVAILAIALAGTVSAAGGDCVCDGSNCTPNLYLWGGRGPH